MQELAHRAPPSGRRQSRTGYLTVLFVAGTLAATTGHTAAAEWRTIDGRGNNLENPERGSAGIPLLRLAPAAYADGISSPAGIDRPGAREVSNALCAQTGTTAFAAGVTDFFWQWGQFLAHDIDFTPAATPTEALPIPVPAGDPFFDPESSGAALLSFSRSAYDLTTGTDPSNPRQQLNQITAFIDASSVYGSDAVRATALRRNDGTGRLKMSRRRLLPFNKDQLPNVGGSRPGFFLAGDERANEQVALTAVHTLFVREHNAQARKIRRRNRRLSGNAIYQQARAIVYAEMQVITYNEFLPVLLGPDALPPYAGYDPEVDPGISNIFSTAAFRFGHSMLSPHLVLLKRAGRSIPAGPLPLGNAFFAPRLLRRTVRLPQLFRGLATHPAQDVDLLVIDNVRNFLFGPPGGGGLDLAALNIQRGRDHGLPNHNQVRLALGLAPALTFADITPDADVQQRLANVYGNVDQVEAWAGGLAEEHRPGALVGELFFTVIKDQFQRLRDGDRFWYQNVFSGEDLATLESTTLGAIIRRNTGARKEMSGNVFLQH